MNSNNISHSGRIVAIDELCTKVEIISQAACSSCHAKGLCGLGESKAKIVEVPTRGWDGYKVGDEVELVLKASLGHKAVWLAYAAPLAVLVAVLLTLSLSGAGELLSGLCALGSVLLYYLVLWLFKGKIAKEYVFNIKR